MIAGHLQEKKGFYYAVLNYTDADKKRQTKWIATHMPVKGNKKKAEAFLMEQRRTFGLTADVQPNLTDKELFVDYLQHWLRIAKTTIATTTYASYCGLIRNPIDPWFRKRQLRLKDLTAKDIQDFYLEQGKRVKPNTVIHYHAIIHRALKYAVKTDLIPSNPADKVDRPRKNTFQASYYTEDEFAQLFAAVEGTLIEVPVKLASYYGLRRSEVMGLKWDAIDFDRNTISIRHTVTSCTVDGKYTVIASDTTKTKSSRRTLPLITPVRNMLLALRKQQAANKVLCSKSWCTADEAYLCLNNVGERLKPSYLSHHFSKALDDNGLRHIRFHDLRHSCATLLLTHHITMKQIQEWLGHSDFSTTANIYAHLDAAAKQESARTIEEVLSFEEE